MLNRVELLGHLGRDPEVRTLQSGEKVANLQIATTDRWRDKQTGERKEVTHWHRVVVFGPVAGIAEQYLRKGSRCFVAGKLEHRKWTDQGGQERYTTEVVLRPFGGELTLLDSRGDGERQSAPQSAGDQGGGWDSGAGDDADSDLPF